MWTEKLNVQCGKLNLACVTKNKRSQVVARIADPTASQHSYISDISRYWTV